MKKINTFLYKHIEKIFLLFLFFQPLIDVLTGISLHYLNSDFTVGIVIRFIFLLYMIYYLLFLSKNKDKKKSLIYLGIILIYCILFSLNIFFTKSLDALWYEIKNLFRVIYFPIFLIILNDLNKSNKCIVTPKLLRNLFIIYSLFILVPNLLNLGFNTYEITKKGSIGFFNSANEIGAIISILMPISFYSLLLKKNNILTAISLIIVIFILLTMGTKGPFLCFFLIILYYVVCYIKESINLKHYKTIGLIVISVIFCFILGTFLIPKTNFYKNIVIHLDYLKVKKVSDLASPKVIDHFIFSERLSFLQRTNKSYLSSPFISKLLGIGYIENYGTDNVNIKTIEMDYFDIFYRHGILGFIIYFTSLGYFLKSIFKIYKVDKKTKIAESYLMSLTLSLILALLTGHVLTSPAVSIYVALIINLLYNELYKGDKSYE